VDILNQINENDLQEKRNELQSFSGDVVLRGDDFKRYVASLRGKSNSYKKKRAELSDLRSEYGVLSRSLEILETRNSRLQHSLSALEAEKGISGYRDTQDSLARMSETQTGKKILKEK
jgi:intraflagellar transport protein 81